MADQTLDDQHVMNVGLWHNASRAAAQQNANRPPGQAAGVPGGAAAQPDARNAQAALGQNMVDGPPPRVDARTLLGMQAQNNAEVGLGVQPGQTTAETRVGTPAGYAPAPGENTIAHTHPGAAENPMLQFPSPNQGDIGMAMVEHRRRVAEAGAQGIPAAQVRPHDKAVVHGNGVTMFNAKSQVSDQFGYQPDGQQGEVARTVTSGVTMVPTTQVTISQENGSAVLWPSADNPVQNSLPVQFPRGPSFMPGTDQSNIDRLSTDREQAQAASIQQAQQRDAAERANAGRRQIGWTTQGSTPIYDGDPLPASYVDMSGRRHFRD